ncbi:TPM domain-containing protein [Flavobacterium agricola]|uniref:TPM domain-containing protein n=1 Tax=Flavobacterium agricola TaxID=2870839 RepID=A0ABY6LW67_9FLAO|nr:TPM domain-containing protein [Flavobacterium agricola]UYW00573.1 TPM domain-containing protein [Flavobacterium agricola]
MSASEQFLSVADERAIVEAIQQAETSTSGEIRVHLEDSSKKPPLERAKEVFLSLQMHNTASRNGVLFYVCVVDHHFVILGDEGINKVVAPDFWHETKDVVISHFKQGQNKEGLIRGILKAGEALKEHFPYCAATDVDELSNEISRS